MSATGGQGTRYGRLRHRWSPATALLLCCLLVLGLCAAGSPAAGTGQAFFPLDSDTVAMGADGALVRVQDPADLVPGTRVLTGTAATAAQAAEQRAWLAAGTLPKPAELGRSTLVRDALLDLHVLSGPAGAPVAGWASAWRYVWPRDSALAATAFARTGHLADADRVLGFLQRVQPESGLFEARYRPDGSPVPDGRGRQTDSLGWALWALDQVTAEVPRQRRRSFVERHRALLNRSAGACLALVDNPRSLPPPSADYWETRERRLSLATAALVRAGLLAAAHLYGMLGDDAEADRLSSAARRTESAITRSFGAAGYPRTVGGSPSTVDLGVSFLLPPFGDPDDAALDSWGSSAAKMARPAGGLAPGGSWRRDGVSWTTATSAHAMTAAYVAPRAQAVTELRWLDGHRTRAGSLPEKVLAGGQPGSVAPLAWAAAAVVIAAAELEDRR